MKFILLLFALIALPLSAWADKVALVIGNARYQNVAELDNPDNDSRAVSQALARQGFDVVSANDLSRTAMRDTLRRFRERADSAEVALVYYAGHGIEISGRNYLVPVDARLEDERDAELEMIDLDLVLAQISGAKALKMVVLDACRNNPFVVKMKRSASGRAISSGLGRIEFAQADTLIAYAAAAGEITPDGVTGTNSPFTQAFVAALDGPPTDVRRLLGRVRDNMRQSVPGAAPFVYTSLGGGEFVINPNSTNQSGPIAPPPEPARGSSISEDFVRIDRDGTFQDWSDFLVRHEADSAHPLYAFALEKRESLRAAPKPAQAVANTASLGVDEQAARDKDNRTLVIVAPDTLTEGEARRRLQTLLAERGCYRGSIDGILGRGSQAGMDRLEGEMGVTFPYGTTEGGVALRAALALIETHGGAKCAQPGVAPRPAQTATPRQATSTAVRQASAPRPKAATPAPPPPDQRNSDSFGRRDSTKLPIESISDCLGNRRKFYDCP